MSLQGTFDTLPVTELFGLLASAAKTGALRLEAGDHEASVFLTGGLCCAVESDNGASSAASDTELAARLVDVGFAFARLAAGSFRFSDSELAGYDTGITTPLEPAVVEIRSLLDQWHEIEATIPSLDVSLRLAPVLRGDEVVVTAREWSLLVAIEGMPTVRELVAGRPQPMMEVCRDLKGLVDRGAIEIGAEVPAVPAVPAVPKAAGVRTVSDARTPGEGWTAGAHRDGAEPTVSLLEPADPYAPVSDDFVTAEAVAEAAADADAVAAGIVSRMARARLSTPDVFANGDDGPVDAAPSVGGDAAGGVTVSADAVTSGSQVSAADGGAAATATEEPAPDRGALLRLFSALKES